MSEHSPPRGSRPEYSILISSSPSDEAIVVAPPRRRPRHNSAQAAPSSSQPLLPQPANMTAAANGSQSETSSSSSPHHRKSLRKAARREMGLARSTGLVPESDEAEEDEDEHDADPEEDNYPDSPPQLRQQVSNDGDPEAPDYDSQPSSPLERSTASQNSDLEYLDKIAFANAGLFDTEEDGSEDEKEPDAEASSSSEQPSSDKWYDAADSFPRSPPEGCVRGRPMSAPPHRTIPSKRKPSNSSDNSPPAPGPFASAVMNALRNGKPAAKRHRGDDLAEKDMAGLHTDLPNTSLPSTLGHDMGGSFLDLPTFSLPPAHRHDLHSLDASSPLSAEMDSSELGRLAAAQPPTRRLRNSTASSSEQDSSDLPTLNNARQPTNPPQISASPPKHPSDSSSPFQSSADGSDFSPRQLPHPQRPRHTNSARLLRPAVTDVASSSAHTTLSHPSMTAAPSSDCDDDGDSDVPAAASEQYNSPASRKLRKELASLKQRYREACGDWERRNGQLRGEVEKIKEEAEYWHKRYKYELNDLVDKKVKKSVEKVRVEMSREVEKVRAEMEKEVNRGGRFGGAAGGKRNGKEKEQTVEEAFAEANEMMSRLAEMDEGRAQQVAKLVYPDVAASREEATNRKGNDRTTPTVLPTSNSSSTSFALEALKTLTSDLFTSLNDLRSATGPTGLTKLRESARKKITANIDKATKALQDGADATTRDDRQAMLRGNANGALVDPIRVTAGARMSTTPASFVQTQAQASTPLSNIQASSSSPPDAATAAAMAKSRIVAKNNSALQGTVRDLLAKVRALTDKLGDEVKLRKDLEKQVAELQGAAG